MKEIIRKGTRLMGLALVALIGFTFTSTASAADNGASSEASSERGYYFSHGWNNLYGTFYYKGNPYGFVISFYYNVNNGQVSNATYQATGYGTSGSRSRITSFSISSNECSLSIKGPNNLRINASCDGRGGFNGSMQRGNHKGTCHMQ